MQRMPTKNHNEDVEVGNNVHELEPLDPYASTRHETDEDDILGSNTPVSPANMEEEHNDEVIITSLLEAMAFYSDKPPRKNEGLGMLRNLGKIGDGKTNEEYATAALDILSKNPPSAMALNQQTDWYRSPLHVAACWGLKNVVDKLLEPECGVNAQLLDSKGNSAADVAFRELHSELAEYLIGKGSILNTINCLLWSIRKYDEDAALDILLRNPPTPEQLNQLVYFQDSPLHSAVRRNLPKVIDKLIKIGANPQLLDSIKQTAADIAIGSCNFKLAGHLIKKGSFFNQDISKGYEPAILELMNYIENCDEASAVALLSKNHPMFTEEQLNIIVWYPPLHLAALNKLDKVVDKLIDCRVDPNIFDIYEQTAADWLIARGKFMAATRMIKKRSNLIKQKSYQPVLQLMTCIEQNEEDSAVALLSSDPPIFAPDNLNISECTSPLHLAAQQGQVRTVLKLLECGADLHLKKHKYEKTAADFAMRAGNYKLVKILEDKGSSLNDENKKLKPLLQLMGCIEDGDEISALAELEAKRPNKDQLNIRVWWPPLHFATQHKLINVVKQLLLYGADKKLTMSGYGDQDKALDVAIKKNYPEIVELLLSHDNANDELPWAMATQDETYLNHAVVYGFDEIMVRLINKGADVTKLPPNAKIPYSVMRKCLDSSISWAKEETIQSYEEKDMNKQNKKKKEERTIQFNYQLIMKTDEKKRETEKFQAFYSSSNSSELLVHPLIKTLLFKKWKKIEWVFWCWILIKFAFYLSLFIIAIFEGPKKNSGNHTSNISYENSSIDAEYNSSNYSEMHSVYNSPSNNESSNTNKNGPLQEESINILFSIFAAIFGITELFQAMKTLYNKFKNRISKIPSFYSTDLKNAYKLPFYFTNKKKPIKTPAYFTDMKNYIQWTIIICLTIIIVDHHISFLKNSDRRNIFGVLLPLSCLEFLHQMGHIPGCAHIIQIFNMVLWTFLTYLAFYSLLIISFAASFYVILPPPDEPDNYPTNFFMLLAKYIVMFTGEQEFMEVPFPKEQNWFEIILFIIFLILVAIVLMNVLNALAVRDVQEMMKEVEIPMMEQLLDKVLLLEAILHTLEKYDCFGILPNMRLFEKKSSTNIIEFYPFKENTDTGLIGFIKKYIFTEKMTKLFLYTYQVIEKECIHGPNGALSILSLKKDEQGNEKRSKLNDDLVRQMHLQVKQVHLELKENNKKEENNKTKKSEDGTSQYEEGNENADDLFKQTIENMKKLTNDQIKIMNGQINEMLTKNRGSEPINEKEIPVIDR